MKRKNIWLLGGGVLLAVIIGGAAMRGDQGQPVQVAAVARETITAKVSANGKVQAVAKVDISANLMGQVTHQKKQTQPAGPAKPLACHGRKCVHQALLHTQLGEHGGHHRGASKHGQHD